MSPPDSPDNAPKYIAPGVYIEEIAPGLHTIAPVSTSTAAMAGLAVNGPSGTASKLITAYLEFKELYGDTPFISLGGLQIRNYLALAVRAFFDNGGARLYVSRVTASDGTNSSAPAAEDYARALSAFESLRDISIVAAPGGTVAGTQGIAAVAPVHAALIAHTNRPAAYRFAVLDPPPGCSLSDVQALRSGVDSKNAALYYPWVTIADPASTAKPAAQLNVPPSGFLCGIYARTDMQQGVYKAPANQPIIGAIGFELAINDRQNELLNPLGINSLRSFPGRGNRVWGARTVSSDPEWKYINLQRYFLYLEHSIDLGTQWAVFEPNNEHLWASVKQTVESFLFNEWKSGALLGAKPDEAYFVKCDGTTMTQNDLDNGRLICIVGVAAIKPAEFVIFRIGQWTSSSSHPPI
jgi:phage tail sheath protein FI